MMDRFSESQPRRNRRFLSAKIMVDYLLLLRLKKLLLIFAIQICTLDLTSASLAAISSNIDSFNNGLASGWVYDTSTPSVSLNIEIFLDGTYGKGTYLGVATADQPSPDVDVAFGIQGSHRFQWSIPAPPDNNVHLYYFYANQENGIGAIFSSGPIAYPPVSLMTHQTPESIFNGATQACDEDDFPDHPARAFRTADGKTHLIASWIHVREFKGHGLNSLNHNCNTIYNSQKNQDFTGFDYYQWLESPYTTDGKTIYNITQNDWYGNLVDPSCKGDLIDGWVSAQTLLVSHNMGQSFEQPLSYIIRHPATTWNNSFPCNQNEPTRYGDVGGSNVFSYNGAYYKFFYYEPEPLVQPPTGWQCLMRTHNLNNPNVYYVLTDNGWSADQTIPCLSVGGNIMFRSVTFNTYLNLYVAIFQSGTSFYFCLSKDIINWSVPTQIKLPNINTSNWVYPSLLDPMDTSLNFENTGQGAFLYYTLLTNVNTVRDLMRIRLWFSISTAQSNG